MIKVRLERILQFRSGSSNARFYCPKRYSRYFGNVFVRKTFDFSEDDLTLADAIVIKQRTGLTSSQCDPLEDATVHHAILFPLVLGLIGYGAVGVAVGVTVPLLGSSTIGFLLAARPPFRSGRDR